MFFRSENGEVLLLISTHRTARDGYRYIVTRNTI